jgi:hypothetical protein
MRDTIANITIPTIRSTLEVVRNQFEAWRKKRSRRGPIPEALWQAALELCKEHSIFEVSRALRLNYNGLKDRVLRARSLDHAIKPRPDLGFVKLEMGSPRALSESFKGSLRDFDAVDLSRAFWRQG